MRSESRHRGEAGGGWLFGFPPLLATDGRNHKGDCDMRTGAIFARGSCRGLAWVLGLAIVVVASAAGEALAQNATATGITVTPGSVTVDEADANTFRVGLNGTLGEGATVTVTVATDTGGDDDGADFRVDNVPLPQPAGSVSDRSFVFTGPDDDSNPGTFLTRQPNSHLVVVRALEDGNSENGRNILIFSSDDTHDHDGDGGTTAEQTISDRRLTIIEADNDEVGVIVSERSLTLREGGAAGEYTIMLGSEPTHDVSVLAAVTSPVNARIMVDDRDTSTLLFTRSNWNRPQTVMVTAVEDTNTLSGKATITHTVTSDDPSYHRRSTRSVSVTEIDGVRTLTLSVSSDSVMEGKSVTVTATLGNSNPDDDSAPVLPSDVMISFTEKAGRAKLGKFSLPPITIAAGDTASAETLEARHDADESDVSLAFVASIEGNAQHGVIIDDQEGFTLTIEDDDSYELTADDTEVAEGDKVKLTVELTPEAEFDTRIRIDLYRASGATVAPAPGADAEAGGDVWIREGDNTAEFILTTAKDALDANDEMIEARAMVVIGSSSSAVGDRVKIDVLDAQAMPEYTFTFEPTFIGEADGEQSVMLMAMTNKAVTADRMVKFAVEPDGTAMDPDDYSIMPESGMIELTIEKGEEMGMTTLMVTPVMDSMDESNETIVLSGWVDEREVGNHATLTIIDGDSPGSGIMAKSSDEVEEIFHKAIMEAGGLVGGQDSVFVDMSMLFEMANPNMMVNYTVSSSDTEVLGVYTAATDSTLADTILRLAPMMPGESMVTVMAEAANGSMAVSSVTAFTCTGACVSVNLTVWDAAVPALPVIGQLLLAALMAVGGYRRYRRR